MIAVNQRAAYHFLLPSTWHRTIIKSEIKFKPGSTSYAFFLTPTPKFKRYNSSISGFVKKMMNILHITFKLHLAFILLSVLVSASNGGSCVVRMSGGKITKYGNCQNQDQKNTVVGQIKKRAETERQDAAATATTRAYSLPTLPPPPPLNPLPIIADLHYGPVQDSCKTSSGGCFWTVVSTQQKTSLTAANKTCKSFGSVLAVIPDIETYDNIANDIRSKLSKTHSGVWCWLGMTYIAKTKTVLPKGALNGRWYPYYPNSNPTYTGVLINVLLNAKTMQGLRNSVPSDERGGVVCWKPPKMQPAK